MSQDLAIRNEFLAPVMRFLDATMSTRGLDCRSALEAVRSMLEEIPVQAAFCPVCCDEQDAPRGEVPEPTVVRKRDCGHWACDKCSRICGESECANDMCGDCYQLCEGCNEAHCPEHRVARNYCAECAPRDVLREARRPAYCFEGER